MALRRRRRPWAKLKGGVQECYRGLRGMWRAGGSGESGEGQRG